MKFLTMNLWHGLSPTSIVAFERLEPEPRRAIREKLQIELLKKSNSDIAFFQEVNPVGLRFKALCSELKRHGAYQPDWSGLSCSDTDSLCISFPG